MNLPSPDWLHHAVLADGPQDDLLAFSRAVEGSGVTPWAMDYQQFAEDWFYRLTRYGTRNGMSIYAARRLSTMLAEAVFQEHEHAVAWVGKARGCPFDLHSIVPVPWDVLRLGFEHDAAVGWMWEHWGTTWPLRHVRRRVGTRGRDRPHAWACEFFAADWTPWPVIATLRMRFASLRIEVSIGY